MEGGVATGGQVKRGGEGGGRGFDCLICAIFVISQRHNPASYTPPQRGIARLDRWSGTLLSSAKTTPCDS